MTSLPDGMPPLSFFIVGAMKCGTTALVHALNAHPRVFLPRREVHFFDDDAAYHACFDGGGVVPDALREHFGQHFETDKDVLGSKTPSYLAAPIRLERIQRWYPDTKVVVMLRDPVDRAQSHWNHLLRAHERGNVPAEAIAASFADKAADDRAEIDRARVARAEPSFHNIVQRGLYAEQLAVVFSLFPRERVLIEEQAHLDARPAEVLEAVQRFIGVDFEHATVAALSGERPGGRPHTVALTDAERTDLRAFYAEPDRELAALLGRAPSWVS